MKISRPLLVALLSCAPLLTQAAEHAVEAAVITPAGTSGNAGYLERAGELAIHALALIGVNYKYGSNSPERGFDCSGLVSHVFQEVTGILLPRNSLGMSKVGQKIEKSELQPGDLVFFNTRRRAFSHVGIYIGDARFVHAPSRGREVEVTDMRDGYWQKRYDGARRVNF